MSRQPSAYRTVYCFRGIPTFLADGLHVDCNATVMGNTLVPVGMNIKAGEVYRNKDIRPEKLFFNVEAWVEKLADISERK